MSGRNGITSVINFGKYRGRAVGEILEKDDGPGYLVWLREQKKLGDPNFFTREVNVILNKAIDKSKSLKSKYHVWNLDFLEVSGQAPVELMAVATTEYEEWGAF